MPDKHIDGNCDTAVAGASVADHRASKRPLADATIIRAEVAIHGTRTALSISQQCISRFRQARCIIFKLDDAAATYVVRLWRGSPGMSGHVLRFCVPIL